MVCCQCYAVSAALRYGIENTADSIGTDWHAGPSQVLPRSSASFTAGITNNSCTFTIGTNPGLGRDNDSGSGPLAGLRSLFRSHTIDTQLQAQLPGASGALLQHMTSLPAFVDSSLPHPPQVWPPAREPLLRCTTLGRCEST